MGPTFTIEPTILQALTCTCVHIKGDTSNIQVGDERSLYRQLINTSYIQLHTCTCILTKDDTPNLMDLRYYTHSLSSTNKHHLLYHQARTCILTKNDTSNIHMEAKRYPTFTIKPTILQAPTYTCIVTKNDACAIHV